MEAMEAILTRRSIRKYTDKPISPKCIDELIRAAMAAPSAHNAQPWHFVIIEDHQILDKIPETHPNAVVLYQAQVAIAVCGDSKNQSGWWMVDCAAATQNILIAAHARGLGGVWIGVYPIAARMRELQELIKLPDYILPLALVSLGYPAEHKEPANRYDAAKIHKNLW